MPEPLGYVVLEYRQTGGKVAGAAEAKIRRIEHIHCWRNEDGKQFLFADDVRSALKDGKPDV
jgi:hypothetical protein